MKHKSIKLILGKALFTEKAKRMADNTNLNSLQFIAIMKLYNAFYKSDYNASSITINFDFEISPFQSSNYFIKLLTDLGAKNFFVTTYDSHNLAISCI